MIEEKVIPRWKKYLKLKSSKITANPKNKPRIDTFRKKVLRDIREFYRILFRARFHYDEFQNIFDIRS